MAEQGPIDSGNITPEAAATVNTGLPPSPAQSPASGSAGDYQSNPFRPLMTTLGHTLLRAGIPAVQLVLLVYVGIAAFYLLTAAGLLLRAPGLIVILAALAGLLYWIGRIHAAEVKLVNDAAQGGSKAWKQYFQEAAPLSWRVVGAALAAGLIVCLGLIVLIIPGLYLLGRLALTSIVLVVEDLSVGAALKRSWQLSRGHVLEVLGSLIASVVVSANGLLGSLVPTNSLYGRYVSLRDLAPEQRPRVHWLNYLLVIGAPILLALVIVIEIAIGVHHPGTTTDPYNYNSSYLETQ